MADRPLTPPQEAFCHAALGCAAVGVAYVIGIFCAVYTATRKRAA